MSNCSLAIWEFAKAPRYIQILVPVNFHGGWVALVRPGNEELVAYIVGRNAIEPPVFETTMEEGIILAGAHLQQPYRFRGA